MASRGDFIGFTFNGRHSSDLGIMRVSDGSRYNDNLLPTFQDKTATAVGGDGTYFWNSYYTQKPFPLKIAFDEMTETNYRQLRQWLGDKQIHELIFDEHPYKQYMVKVQGTPQLKTICFDVEGKRIYKGEGTINFVAFSPYAHSVHKWLDEYDCENKSEWSETSGMISARGDYDKLSGGKILLFNPGDVETDFCLYSNFNLLKIAIGADLILEFNPMTKKRLDFGIRINSKTNLIEGVDENKSPTGTLYNEYVKCGDFFKIPIGRSELIVDGVISDTDIEYDYLYY